MPWFVATFVFFAMPVGVDKEQDGENQTADDQHEDERLVLPYFRHKGKKVFEKIRIHSEPIYIRPNENQKRKASADFYLLPPVNETGDFLLRFRRQRFDRLGRDQRRAFEQAAEIFFAGVLVRAAGELEIGGGLVTDSEAFEFNDADELRAALPDLSLLKFERHGIWKSGSPEVQVKRAR
jgi:hypothetical protein